LVRDPIKWVSLARTLNLLTWVAGHRPSVNRY
jgi:hypothetical protein